MVRKRAAVQTEAWMHQIARACLFSLCGTLPKKKVRFPLFDAGGLFGQWRNAGYGPQMYGDLIAEHGIRNALLTRHRANWHD